MLGTKRLKVVSCFWSMNMSAVYSANIYNFWESENAVPGLSWLGTDISSIKDSTLNSLAISVFRCLYPVFYQCLNLCYRFKFIKLDQFSVSISPPCSNISVWVLEPSHKDMLIQGKVPISVKLKFTYSNWPSCRDHSNFPAFIKFKVVVARIICPTPDMVADDFIILT